MERTSQTLETSAIRKEGIAESAANEMGGVSRNVATFVVTVEGEVETEKILEALVLLASLAQHGSKVVRPILLEIDLGGESTATTVRVLVDLSSNGGQLGEQFNAVVKGGLPVVSLVEALLIGLGELGVVVEGRDSNGKLGHGVQVDGEVVEHLVDKSGQLSLFGQLTGKGPGLVDGGDLAGEEQPEHGLGQHLSACLALGQIALAVLDGAAVEADTLIGVEDRALPDHGLEATHAAERVLDLDLANDLASVGLDLLEQLTLGGDDLPQRGLEIRLGRGVASYSIGKEDSTGIWLLRDGSARENN